MRVLVTGAKGMLGTDCVAEFRQREWEIVGLDLAELDLTNPAEVARIPGGEWGSFQACVNCAAYTAVDRAETERDTAMAVNGLAPGYLAQACGLAGIKLFHFSTDFVFDGEKAAPYNEDDAPNPRGVYAQSKLQGEEAVLTQGGTVVRTSWLFGPNGGSFPRTMIRAWKAGRDLRVVADQTGTPTYTADLARVLGDLMANPRAHDHALYHAGGPDAMTWHQFAVLAIETYAREIENREQLPAITPIRTEDWPVPTPRPAYSALSFERLASIGIEPMRPIPEALAEFVRRLPTEL